MKNFIRKKTDQTFEKMKILTAESLIHFNQKNTNFKLWRRFWRVLALYKEGKTYEEVLTSLFSKKYKGKDKNHLKISNEILDDDI